MNAKTMEGLTGASTNINLMNTPMRVYKEARRRGDTSVMERAMQYAGDFADKAEKYKVKADEGMEEDAKDAREKAKLEREKAVRERREEREKLEKKIEEDRNADIQNVDMNMDMDTLEISEDGKVLWKGCADFDDSGIDKRCDNAVKEPVTYTKTGEAVPMEQAAVSIHTETSV